MKTTYLLCKLKPNKRQVWLDWCRELMTTHYDEAVITLGEEDLVYEGSHLFENDYVVFVHTANHKKKEATNRELNRKHFKKMRECLIRIGVSDPGYEVVVR